MHAVVRSYTGASALMKEMTQKSKDIEKLLKDVPGFKAYYAVGAGDKVTTVTVCDDQAGTTESTRRAAAWVKENLTGVSISPPQVTDGNVFVNF